MAHYDRYDAPAGRPTQQPYYQDSADAFNPYEASGPPQHQPYDQSGYEPQYPATGGYSDQAPLPYHAGGPVANHIRNQSYEHSPIQDKMSDMSVFVPSEEPRLTRSIGHCKMSKACDTKIERHGQGYLWLPNNKKTPLIILSGWSRTVCWSDMLVSSCQISHPPIL